MPYRLSVTATAPAHSPMSRRLPTSPAPQAESPGPASPPPSRRGIAPQMQRSSRRRGRRVTGAADARPRAWQPVSAFPAPPPPSVPPCPERRTQAHGSREVRVPVRKPRLCRFPRSVAKNPLLALRHREVRDRDARLAAEVLPVGEGHVRVAVVIASRPSRPGLVRPVVPCLHFNAPMSRRSFMASARATGSVLVCKTAMQLS